MVEQLEYRSAAIATHAPLRAKGGPRVLDAQSPFDNDADLDGSIVALEASLKAQPNSVAIRLYLGVLYRQKKDFANALKYLLSAVQSAPQFCVYECWENIAGIAEERNDYAVAIGIYEQILQMHPADQHAKGERDRLRKLADPAAQPPSPVDPGATDPATQPLYLTKHRTSELTPIGRFDPGDIFIAGYPKSGNTWFQYLMAGLLYGVNVTLAPLPLIQDLTPDVHECTLYQRFSNPCVFKTHALPKPEYKRVLYLLRDGRDVMVSYFHHTQALNQARSFERMIEAGEGLFPCRWHEHVAVWQANPYRAQIMQIRYEDMMESPVAQLRRFCAFFGVERDEQHLEECVRRASFENMRIKEAKDGVGIRAWPKDRAFVRRGVVGSHKDEMPAQLLARFNQEAGAVLKKTGYIQ